MDLTPFELLAEVWHDPDRGPVLDYAEENGVQIKRFDEKDAERMAMEAIEIIRSCNAYEAGRNRLGVYGAGAGFKWLPLLKLLPLPCSRPWCCLDQCEHNQFLPVPINNWGFRTLPVQAVAILKRGMQKYPQLKSLLDFFTNLPFSQLPQLLQALEAGSYDAPPTVLFGGSRPSAEQVREAILPPVANLPVESIADFIPVTTTPKPEQPRGYKAQWSPMDQKLKRFKRHARR